MWEELKLVNKDFLFGCGSRFGTDSEPSDAEGFVRGHAYTVLEAREVGEERLLKIRSGISSRTRTNCFWLTQRLQKPVG